MSNVSTTTIATTSTSLANNATGNNASTLPNTVERIGTEHNSTTRAQVEIANPHNVSNISSETLFLSSHENEFSRLSTKESIPTQAVNAETRPQKMRKVGKMQIMPFPKFKKCEKHDEMTICYYEEQLENPFPDHDEIDKERVIDNLVEILSPNDDATQKRGNLIPK